MFPPVGIRRRFRKKRVGFCLADAGLAAAVLLDAQAGHDVGDHVFRRLVAGGVGGDDAVAIELGGRENFRRVGGVFQTDRGGVAFAEIGQNLFGRRQHLLSFRDRVIDGGQGQRRRTVQQIVGFFEQAGRPFGGGDDFRDAHAAILVGVNEVERAAVKFQPPSRTSKGDTEFLVELIEMGEVGAGFQFDLIESAGAEEFPSMAHKIIVVLLSVRKR